MKYLKRLVVFLLFLMFIGTTAFAQDYNMRKTLTSAAQDFTSGWVNLGSAFRTTGGDTITLWLVLDINNTVNAQFRVLFYHTSGGDAYSPQIITPDATVNKIEPQYFEVETDADQNIVVDFGILGTAYAQVQIKAGTVGATAGQIDESYYMVTED